MAQDWDIKPRGDACHVCRAAFADQQPYFSALIFGEQGYQRADYCGGCWEAGGRSEALYSTWQGIFKMPAPGPEDPLKKETAESLLRRLMEGEDSSKTNVIYILAVMLERKRVLVERDVQIREDGTMIRVYEHRRSGETFLIPDPRLRLDQIQEVQREVVTLLGGTPPPESPPAAAPVAAVEAPPPEAGSGAPAPQA